MNRTKLERIAKKPMAESFELGISTFWNKAKTKTGTVTIEIEPPSYPSKFWVVRFNGRISEVKRRKRAEDAFKLGNEWLGRLERGRNER